MEHLPNTKAYKELEKRSERCKSVVESYKRKLEILESFLEEEYSKLNCYFREYPDHGWKHTIRVLDYMYDLVDKPDELSEYEIMLIIFSALLHDIGMALDDNDAKELIPRYDSMEKERVSEIIRAKHGEFVKEKIKREPLNDVFQLSLSEADNENVNVRVIVETICCSHTKPIHWIQKKWRNNEQIIYIACLLRLADLLDIDGRRTKSYSKFNNAMGEIHNLFNNMIVNSPKINNEAKEACREDCPNKKSSAACDKCYKRISISAVIPYENIGDSEKAQLKRMISDYKNDVETEVLEISSILENANAKYRIKLFPTVKYDMISSQPEDAVQIDAHKLAADYVAIKRILFDVQFYENKWCGVREIIQNAYDACKAFAELGHKETGWKANVTIIIDEPGNQIIFRDNGIGMDDFVIKEYFLNFGKSIFNCDAAYLYDEKCRNHIGNFGIGFFAAFMLSSKVTVKTQSTECAKSTTIELDKNSNFATLKYNCKPIGHGTEIIFNYSEFRSALVADGKEELMLLLKQHIEKYFLDDGIQFSLTDKNSGETQEVLPRKFTEKEKNTISKYLAGVDANVKISRKEFPPIFYAEKHDKLQIVEYEELLRKLADKGESGSLPYLNAGTFLLFPGDDMVEKDFRKYVECSNPRRNYSPGTPISDSIPTPANQFCDEHGLAKAKYCEYGFLEFVIRGDSAALCDTNIICAGVKNKMRLNDACGEPPRDDTIFLHNVLLPSLHICLPKLNFRYDFDWLFANIRTNNVFPTVTRNTLVDERTKELAYAIGYASTRLKIEQGADAAENHLIIDTFYKELDKNIFVRKD